MRITDELFIEGQFFTADAEVQAFHKGVELRKYAYCVMSYAITRNTIKINSGFKYSRSGDALYGGNDITYYDFKMNSPMDYIHLIEYIDAHGVPIEKVRSFINNTLQIAQAAQVLNYYENYLQDGTQS